VVEVKTIPLKFLQLINIYNRRKIEANPHINLRESSKIRTVGIGHRTISAPIPSPKKSGHPKLASLQNLLTLLTLERVPVVVCAVGI
jgi:hypothetical protein